MVIQKLSAIGYQLKQKTQSEEIKDFKNKKFGIEPSNAPLNSPL